MRVCLEALSSTRHSTPLSINFFTTIREQKLSYNRKSSSLLLVTSLNFGKKDSNERNYILHRRPKIFNEPQKDPIIQRWPKYRRRNLTFSPIYLLVNLFSIAWSFYIFIHIISPLQSFKFLLFYWQGSNLLKWNWTGPAELMQLKCLYKCLTRKRRTEPLSRWDLNSTYQKC